jgi:predicted dehydrogenase
VVESVLALEVPVFVEKPLTCDEQDAARIVDRAPNRVFVMDKWRYHPGVAALARIARSGELGAVQGLRTVRVQSAAVHTDVDCTWTLAPHDLSIALEVLGVVPTPVAAVGHVEAGWPSGLIGLLRDGEGPWLTVDIASNAPAHVRRIELHCTGGVATLGDGWDEHVTITEATAEDGATRTVRVVPAAGELPLAAELRAFVDHLAGGPPPRSSALEGLRAVETIAELRRLAGFAG